MSSPIPTVFVPYVVPAEACLIGGGRAVADGDGGRGPTFAQRNGYVPFTVENQVETLDDRSRMDLWNLVVYPNLLRYPSQALVRAEVVWVHHMAKERHKFSEGGYANLIRDIVINGEWHVVYDLLEFLVGQVSEYRRHDFATPINKVLAINRAGYRVIDTEVVPITSAEEVSAIESATRSPLTEAGKHIKQALALFSNRDSPNFAKVIHEAVSGAEAAAQVLAGKPGASLADALSQVGKQDGNSFHPALIEGWKRIYGFTSDSGGIRHALKEGTAVPDQDLAQYFVITCSAFVNLVAALKASGNGD